MKRLLITLLVLLCILPVNALAVGYLGSWKIDDALIFPLDTYALDTGAATDADAAPSYRIYEDETATPLLTGNMALLDSGNTAGLYSESITLSAANGFELGRQYTIYTEWTVDSVTTQTVFTFQIAAEPPTAADAADAVWDELRSGHTTAGSFGATWTDLRLDELLSTDSDIDGASPPAVGSVFFEALSASTGSFTYNQITDSNEAIANNLTNNIGANGDNLTYLENYLSNIPTVAEFQARTLPAANYFDHTTDTADANVVEMIGTALFESNPGDVAGAFSQFFDVISTTSTVEAIEWNPVWDAEIQSEVQDAIEANHLDHLLAVDYDPASKPGTATALLNELVESDAGVSRFNANTLEEAPTGGGDVNVTQIMGTNLFESNPGDVADAFSQFFDVISTTSTVEAIEWNPVWNAEVRAALFEDTYDLSANASDGSAFGRILDPDVDASWDYQPVNSSLQAIRTYMNTEIGFGGDALDSIVWNADWNANVRASVGMATNNLDTQLGDIPTVAEFSARTKPTADYFDSTTDNVILGTVEGTDATDYFDALQRNIILAQ